MRYKKTAKKSLVRLGGGRNVAVMKPQLTSLIDVMTILLVFLLKSFSVDGNLIQVSPNINLPESTSDKKPVATLNIEVNMDEIAVDGKTVVPMSDIENAGSMMIAPLHRALKHTAAASRFLADGGKVVIQCDSAMDFRVLKKVMYTCGKAKFTHFSLLVREDVS